MSTRVVIDMVRRMLTTIAAQFQRNCIATHLWIVTYDGIYKCTGRGCFARLLELVPSEPTSDLFFAPSFKGTLSCSEWRNEDGQRTSQFAPLELAADWPRRTLVGPRRCRLDVDLKKEERVGRNPFKTQFRFQSHRNLTNDRESRAN